MRDEDRFVKREVVRQREQPSLLGQLASLLLKPSLRHFASPSRGAGMFLKRDLLAPQRQRLSAVRPEAIDQPGASLSGCPALLRFSAGALGALGTGFSPSLGGGLARSSPFTEAAALA